MGYDHGVFGALERVTDHRSLQAASRVKFFANLFQTLFTLCRCNGTPDCFPTMMSRIMLGGSALVRQPFWRSAGKNVAVFTNNDDGWRTASDLIARGVTVRALIDVAMGSAHLIYTARSHQGAYY